MNDFKSISASGAEKYPEFRRNLRSEEQALRNLRSEITVPESPYLLHRALGMTAEIARRLLTTVSNKTESESEQGSEAR